MWGCFASNGTSVAFPEADAGVDTGFEGSEPDAERTYDPPPTWSGGAPVNIESGQQAISLAVDSSEVYWQNPGGSVFACPLDGCADSKPTLLSSLIGPASGDLDTLAAGDGVAVFFTDQGNQISSFAGANPKHSPTTYRTSAGLPGLGFVALTADATQAYFVDTSITFTETLYSCPLGASCSSAKKLFVDPNGETLRVLFAEGSDVYFVDLGTGEIRAVPTHGGTARTVCTSNLLAGLQVQALVVAGGHAYFTTSSEPTSVYQCTASGGGDAAVFIQDLQPYALASDGANLYWTNYVDGAGTVVTCALGATCSSPFTVASKQNSPFAIAANAKSVYWATASKIFRADR
jgi:hypothetical protein